jgi:hypothetical protein
VRLEDLGNSKNEKRILRNHGEQNSHEVQKATVSIKIGERKYCARGNQAIEKKENL